MFGGRGMNKKRLKKAYTCVATTVLLAQFAALPGTIHATEKSTSPFIEQSNKIGENTGLRGTYFSEKNFRKTAIIAPSKNGDLKLMKEDVQDVLSEEKQNVQSVRWIGYITPSQSGEYEFSTSSDEQVMLQIDGKTVIQKSPTKQKIKLEKGKDYEIRLEYVPNKEKLDEGIHLQLFWATSTMKKQMIPEENIKCPEWVQKEEIPQAFPRISLFSDEENNEDLDTDNDGIPDNWEIEGYTIKGQMAVKWDDSLAAKGYKKYQSDPYKASTAGDPYTDFQKAANQMDPATNKVARNPLVAAYPTIGVQLDNLTISKNEDISTTVGGDTSTSITRGTSNSTTNETSEGLDISATASLELSITPSLTLSASVTKTFNQSNSTTATIDNSKTASTGENWAQSIGINTAQAAFLGPRVRYINTGTAPVYQLKPDVSIGIGENHTLTSGIVDEKYKANVLNPNEMFPKKGAFPYLINKHEGSPISIDYNELLSLEKNKKVRLDSTQFDGLVAPTANTEKMEKWERYTNQIEHLTARLIFVDPDSNTLIERRVAAPVDLKDPEDKRPKIDLNEALQIGFEDLKKTEKGYQYKEYEFESVSLIYDEETAENLKEQATQTEGGKLDPLKMQLQAKMNIQMSPKGWVTNTKTGKKYYFENGKLTIDPVPLFGILDGNLDFGSQPEEYAYYNKIDKKIHILTGNRGYKFEKKEGKFLKSVSHPNGVVEAIYDANDEWFSNSCQISFYLQKGNEKNELSLMSGFWVQAIIDKGLYKVYEDLHDENTWKINAFWGSGTYPST